MLDFLSNGACWPPLADQERISGYKRFKLLFKGKHADAFATRSARVPRGKRRIIYLAANYPGLISRVSADLLVGQEPTFSVGEPGTPQQEALKKIVQENGFVQALHEGGQAHSYNGDVVFGVRWGSRRPGLPPSVIIELKPAYTYFVERARGNTRTVLSEALAWEESLPDGRPIVRVEHHLVGRIEQEAFLLGTGQFELPRGPRREIRIHEKLTERFAVESLGEKAVQDTKIPASLLVHIPNGRTEDELFGISDLADPESLFDSLNGRLTKINSILDKHADPKLVGPKQVLGLNGQVRVEDLQFIEVDKDLGNLPRYLTWDARLESCFKQCVGLLKTIGQVTETSPILGDDEANSIESARALKLRYTPLLNKVARKRLYWDPGVSQVLRVALMLQEAMVPGSVGIPVDEMPAPTVGWRDGLPKDPLEQTQIAVLQVNNRLASRSGSIRDLKGGTDEDARAELERIARDEHEFPAPASFTPPADSGLPPSAPPPAGAGGAAIK